MHQYLSPFLSYLLATVIVASPLHVSTAVAKSTKKWAEGVNADNFIEGNLHFFAYHELGHAMISEFDLPVTGREEDAVDRLAIWMMTPEEKTSPPDYLMGAMKGWFLSAEGTVLQDIEWWDSHGTDQQRAFQISCLLYGADVDRYKFVADAAALPEDRRETCAEETALNDKTWDQLLSPKIRAENEARSNVAKVVYQPTEEYKAELDYLKSIGLLEHIQDLVNFNYRFASNMTIEASECGESNAYWHNDSKTLTMCYEMVAEFLNAAK
jgi:Putative metallopeptidase